MSYFGDITANANRISKTMLSGTDFSHTDATHSSSSDFNNFLNTLDDTNYDIDDDTTTTDWLTATTTILAGAASLTKELGTAFGNSSSTTTDTTTPTAAGGSGLSGAISNFESEPSAGNRQALINQMNIAKGTISENIETIDKLSSMNDILKAGGKNADSLREAFKAQASTAIEKRADAMEQLTAAETSKNLAETNLGTVAQAIAETSSEITKSGSALEQKIIYKDGQADQITIGLSDKATAEDNLESIVSSYQELVGKRTGLSETVNSKHSALEEVVNHPGNYTKKEPKREFKGGEWVYSETVVPDPAAHQEAINNAERELEEAKRLEKENEDAITALEEKITVNNTKLSEINKNLKDAQEAVDQANTEINELGAQLSEYQIKQTNEEEAKVQAQSNILAAEASIEANSNLVTSVAEAGDELKNILDDTEKLDNDAKEIYKQNKKEINNLTKENDRLQNDINRANNALASHPESGSSYNKGDKITVGNTKYTIEKHNDNGIIVKDEAGKKYIYDIVSNTVTPKK